MAMEINELREERGTTERKGNWKGGSDRERERKRG